MEICCIKTMKQGDWTKTNYFLVCTTLYGYYQKLYFDYASVFNYRCYIYFFFTVLPLIFYL